eukprot:NODE_809_length_4047_cov_0.715805.p2 type:complete len:289 gc:universal NODE_809_length_4047_cov_0.715805:3684-2818(-)
MKQLPGLAKSLNSPQRSRTISISKPYITKVKVLGIGAFAKVELVSRDGEEFALKSGEVQREYEFLKNLKHKNLIKCYQYIDMSNIGGLLLDYVRGGELFTLIAFHYDLMQMSWITTIIKELADVMKFLHSNGVAHRDLKLENVLLRSLVDCNSNPPQYPFKIILCDLGLATNEEKSTEHCGSKEYAAPELILQQEYNPRLVDMWALGVIWYACCCGNLPFGNPETLAKQVVRKRKKMEFLIADIQYEFIESSKLLNKEMKYGIQHLICHRDTRWQIQSLVDYVVDMNN